MNICNVKEELVRLFTKTDASSLVSKEYRFDIKFFCRAKKTLFSEVTGDFLLRTHHNDGYAASKADVLHDTRICSYSLQFWLMST